MIFILITNRKNIPIITTLINNKKIGKKTPSVHILLIVETIDNPMRIWRSCSWFLAQNSDQSNNMRLLWFFILLFPMRSPLYIVEVRVNWGWICINDDNKLTVWECLIRVFLSLAAWFPLLISTCISHIVLK